MYIHYEYKYATDHTFVQYVWSLASGAACRAQLHVFSTYFAKHSESLALLSCVRVYIRTQVRIGMNFTVDVGVLQYELNVFIYAIPAAVAGLIILLVLVFSITCCIYVRFKRSNKERDRQFQGLLAQMELMESELAEECRRGGLQLCGCACVGVSSLGYRMDSIRQHAFSISSMKSLSLHSIAFKCTVVLGVHTHWQPAYICIQHVVI